MARKIVKTRGGLSIVDMFGVGLAKALGEKTLQPLVGNGTYISGGVKIAGAYFLPSMIGGKAGTILGTALAVDGVEDVLNQVLQGGLGMSTDGGEI